MAKKQEQKGGGAVGAIIGAGVLAAAAGVYFLYGSKDATKNRKVIKGWVLRAKGEVIDALENVREVNEEKYHAAIDKVMKKYAQMKSIDPKEVEALGKDMKRHWKSFKGDLVKVTKVSKKIVKKAVA